MLKVLKYGVFWYDSDIPRYLPAGRQGSVGRVEYRYVLCLYSTEFKRLKLLYWACEEYT